MKVIIAGSRDINDYDVIKLTIKKSGFKISEIVSGGARGVEKLGERYAKENNIVIIKYIPKWNLYGKSAGYKRNVEMAEYADAVICIWDGKSKGTKHMINIAKEKKLKIFKHRVWE